MILSVKGSLITYAACDFSNILRITSAFMKPSHRYLPEHYHPIDFALPSLLLIHENICIIRSLDGSNIDPTKGQHIHTLFTCRIEEFRIQSLCQFRPHAMWTYWLGMGWSYPDFSIITGRLNHPIWESAWTCIVQPVNTQNLIASHFHQVDSRNVSKLPCCAELAQKHGRFLTRIRYSISASTLHRYAAWKFMKLSLLLAPDRKFCLMSLPIRIDWPLEAHTSGKLQRGQKRVLSCAIRLPCITMYFMFSFFILQTEKMWAIRRTSEEC